MILAAGGPGGGGWSGTRAVTTLQRIADALRIPVEDLSRPTPTDPVADDGAELVRLWRQIDDPVQRRVILNIVRRLVPNSDPQ